MQHICRHAPALHVAGPCIKTLRAESDFCRQPPRLQQQQSSHCAARTVEHLWQCRGGTHDMSKRRPRNLQYTQVAALARELDKQKQQGAVAGGQGSSGKQQQQQQVKRQENGSIGFRCCAQRDACRDHQDKGSSGIWTFCVTLAWCSRLHPDPEALEPACCTTICGWFCRSYAARDSLYGDLMPTDAFMDSPAPRGHLGGRASNSRNPRLGSMQPSNAAA